LIGFPGRDCPVEKEKYGKYGDRRNTGTGENLGAKGGIAVTSFTPNQGSFIVGKWL